MFVFDEFKYFIHFDRMIDGDKSRKKDIDSTQDEACQQSTT